jgi:hypothetical protein
MVDRLLRIDYQHYTSWGTNKMMMLFIKYTESLWRRKSDRPKHLCGLTSLNMEWKALHMIVDVSTDNLQEVITQWHR